LRKRRQPLASHIIALGGGGFSMEPDNPLLDDFVLRHARRKRLPRICFVATASGDSDSYIRRFHEAFPLSRAAATHLTFFERKVLDLKSFVMDQDVIYVGGGSGANCWLCGACMDSIECCERLGMRGL
jgi:dipeptidase E